MVNLGYSIGNMGTLTAIVEGYVTLRQGPNNPRFKENAENSAVYFLMLMA
jgi:hypothetical protein